MTAPRRSTPRGLIPRSQVANLRFGAGYLSLYVFEEPTEGVMWGEVGPQIMLVYHPRGSSRTHRPTRITLTELTLEDLDEIEIFLRRARAIAEPIVKERDRLAKLAEERGDATYTRSFASAPGQSWADKSRLLTEEVLLDFTPVTLPEELSHEHDDGAEQEPNAT